MSALGPGCVKTWVFTQPGSQPDRPLNIDTSGFAESRHPTSEEGFTPATAHRCENMRTFLRRHVIACARRCSLRRSSKSRVMFTNFEDRNTINKKAAHLFFDSNDTFLDKATWGDLRSSYYEKSIRNVYQAFEMDFDSLETTSVFDKPL
jgi:hypothetical protein